VGAAIVLYVVAPAGGRRSKQARRLAVKLAAHSSPASVERRAPLSDRPSLAINYFSGALVLGILVLMVLKP
jgi:hypothetical protein